MRFGLCTSLENLEMTERLGFDYIECTVTSIADYSDEEFLKIKDAVTASSIRPERVNVMFPGTMSLIGPGLDKAAVTAYLEGAFARAAGLGATGAVFGSGKSRRFPDNYSFRQGYAELVQITRLIGEAASHHGITVAIEPLNLGETNCINSLREGAMLEADANSKWVTLLADLYHILLLKEPFDNIRAVKEFTHTHIALEEGRMYPIRRTPEVEGFFKALADVGYNGTMSIEGKTENIEQDAAQALAVLRSYVTQSTS
jgi:sugar phosphate isomerase/epimerase